jgi:hypothetical protein
MDFWHWASHTFLWLGLAEIGSGVYVRVLQLRATEQAARHDSDGELAWSGQGPWHA